MNSTTELLSWSVPTPKMISYEAFTVCVYRRLLDPLIRPLRARIVRLCRELGVGKILDIASATGAQCRMLGRAGIEATGLDLSEPMIAGAQRGALRNVHYVQGSAYALPFADADFEACLLSLALHEHSEEERRIMLEEALRVLRPHGYLIIADYTKPSHTFLHVPWHMIRFIEGIAGGTHRAGFHDFMRQGGLDGLLARHSLKPIHRVRSHFGTMGIAVARKER